MNRAMFAGLSGTLAQQTELDVIGNNISNSETIGYKQSRVTFADAYYQTLRGGRSGAQGGDGANGGLNPVQVGSGVQVASIQNLFDQGSMETTGRPLDAGIEGPGMFIVSDAGNKAYTRDGTFTLDDNGTLVSSGRGMKVLGWQATDGAIDSTKDPGALTFNIGEMRPGSATGHVVMGGNVDPTAATGAKVTTSIDVYDSLGAAHTVNVTLTKGTAENTWTCDAASGSDTATGTLTFTSAGALASGSPLTLTLNPGGGAGTGQAVALQLEGVTQLAGTSNLLARTQDGSHPAALLEVGFGDGGTIQGKFADGATETLGQVALATFANEAGLNRSGNNLFQASEASGEMHVGVANVGGRGRVVAGSLEQSDVDLTRSFVDMITTQRAFQASTRAISAADKLLDDVMQIVR